VAARTDNAGGTVMATKESAKIYTHLWYAKEAEEASLRRAVG
jgi:hypothetical protein